MSTIYRIVFNDGNAIKIEADVMKVTKCGVTIFSAWEKRGMHEVCVIPHTNCMSIHVVGPTLRIKRLREEAKRLREANAIFVNYYIKQYDPEYGREAEDEEERVQAIHDQLR